MVIILDALGTRSLWGAGRSKSLISGRVAVRDFVREKVTDFEIPTECTRPNPETPFEMVTVETRVQFVSDTIVISFAPRSTVVSCLLFSYAFDLVTGLMLNGISHDVLFRGALSTGFLHAGKDFLMGKAVDEAAEWHALGDWAGVMLTPMAGEHMDRLVYETPGAPPLGYVKWDVPASRTKGLGSNTLGDSWVMAWPWYAKSRRRDVELLFLEPPVAPDVNRKRLNTMAFFDHLWSGEVSMRHHFMYPGAYVDRFLGDSEGPKDLLDAWFKKHFPPEPPAASVDPPAHAP